ncbi:MAG: hypothetical protein K8S94_13115 [Planctomycetia bacterium]|nr:hypothetical protein [Planctomycetia bacterium]
MTRVRLSCMLLALAFIAIAPFAAAAVDPAAVEGAKKRLEALGSGAACVVDTDGRLTEITIADGSGVTAADLALFGSLPDLEKLQIFNCRPLNDAMVASLTGLTRLKTLALTNTAITDNAVKMIADSFPDLVDLDLSSNTNLTGGAMKPITGLLKLERLTLVQTRFNDLNTRRLSKLTNLEALDLRGNMEAGDMTLGVVGGLPHLKAFKHRSTVVSDEGIAHLAESKTLESLLAQDFAITNASGPHLAALTGLTSLEIFRCQGFGTEGVLALASLGKLSRLTLRDLPEVGDASLEVLGKLPGLKRLYLHELASLGDKGLEHLAAAKSLEVLDIWSLPRMTGASVDVIATLPGLKELSIRETGATEACLERILSLPNLTSLTFINGTVSPATAAKLSAKKWKKLDLGR